MASRSPPAGILTVRVLPNSNQAGRGQAGAEQIRVADIGRRQILVYEVEQLIHRVLFHDSIALESSLNPGAREQHAPRPIGRAVEFCFAHRFLPSVMSVSAERGGSLDLMSATVLAGVSKLKSSGYTARRTIPVV